MCACFLSARSSVPFTVHPHGLSQHLWFFLYRSCEVPKSLKHTGPNGPHLNNKRLLCQGPSDLPPLHKFVRIKGRKIHLPPRVGVGGESESTPANWSQIDVKYDCSVFYFMAVVIFPSFSVFTSFFCFGCVLFSNFEGCFLAFILHSPLPPYPPADLTASPWAILIRTSPHTLLSTDPATAKTTLSRCGGANCCGLWWMEAGWGGK